MENHKQMILPVSLKGDNYLLWSRTTKIVLRSRGMWEHVLRSHETPVDKGKAVVEEEQEVDFDTPEKPQEDSKWDQEDQVVLALLQSSLQPSILAAYSYAETSKELWDTLVSVFGNLSNISRIFKVKKALNELQQEEKPFKDLLGDFRTLWAELEILRPPTTDLKEMNERREQDQVFGLLLTLNESFKGLIHHILRFEKLPTLNEVCMMIQKEEGSKGLFQGTSETAHVGRSNYPQGERKIIWCDHYKMKGHTKEKCWTLYPHLKPMKLRGNSQGFRGDGIAGRGDDMVRKSDLEALIKSIAKLTESGKGLLASKNHKPIIIDSGASHHMISDAKMLANVKSHSGVVKIANGLDVAIKGIGDLEVFKRNSRALYMPDFTSNLLSVQKATKDLDCVAIFSPNDVLFQDSKSGKIIGEGGVDKGLYVLNKKDVGYVNFSALRAVGSCLVWHARLGHPRLKVLQQVFPNLAQDQPECEACILGKHCRTSFPESRTLYNKCFELVHSDVWTTPCFLVININTLFLS